MPCKTSPAYLWCVLLLDSAALASDYETQCILRRGPCVIRAAMIYVLCDGRTSLPAQQFKPFAARKRLFPQHAGVQLN